MRFCSSDAFLSIIMTKATKNDVTRFQTKTPVSMTQHFQALKDLLIRLLGSLAVLEEVSFFFMPSIRAQNDFFLGPPSGCGALSPGFPGLAALYEALPLAFKPPFGFLPSLRCHAGDLAIEHRRGNTAY
jgi:hypothetical protein